MRGMNIYKARRARNRLAVVLYCGAAVLGIVWLFFILFALLRSGIGGLSLAVFSAFCWRESLEDGGSDLRYCSTRLRIDSDTVGLGPEVFGSATSLALRGPLFAEGEW